MTTREKITEILAIQALLEPQDVRADATLEELGIDSMGVVEIIFAIEEAFNIQVPFNANDPEATDFDVSSVSAIEAAVTKLISAQSA